jgi:hypothetical protein
MSIDGGGIAMPASASAGAGSPPAAGREIGRLSQDIKPSDHGTEIIQERVNLFVAL